MFKNWLGKDGRLIVFVAMGGLVVVLFQAWLFPGKAEKKPPLESQPVSSEAVPLATGEEPIEQLFTQAQCLVCHTVPGIPGGKGREGPPLTLASTGPLRLADPQYHGTATTVREYIIESILRPSIYVAPGYPDQVMPHWYGQKLSADALEKIASYLEQLPTQTSSPGRRANGRSPQG